MVLFSRIGINENLALDVLGKLNQDDDTENLKGWSLGGHYLSRKGFDTFLSFGRDEEQNNVVVRNFSAGIGYDAKIFDGYYFLSRFSFNLILDSYRQTEAVLAQPLGARQNSSFSERQFAFGLTQEVTEYFLISLNYSLYTHSQDVEDLDNNNFLLPFRELGNLLPEFLDTSMTLSLDFYPTLWLTLGVSLSRTTAVIDNNQTHIVGLNPEIVIFDNLYLGFNYWLSKGDFSEKSEQFGGSIQYVF